MVNWLQYTNYFNITNEMMEDNYGLLSDLRYFLIDAA